MPCPGENEWKTRIFETGEPLTGKRAKATDVRVGSSLIRIRRGLFSVHKKKKVPHQTFPLHHPGKRRTERLRNAAAPRKTYCTTYMRFTYGVCGLILLHFISHTVQAGWCDTMILRSVVVVLLSRSCSSLPITFSTPDHHRNDLRPIARRPRSANNVTYFNYSAAAFNRSRPPLPPPLVRFTVIRYYITSLLLSINGPGHNV